MKTLNIILSLCFMLTACERKPDLSDISVAAQQSMQEKFAATPAQKHIIIDSFTLIHESDNKYKGVLQTSEFDVKHSYIVEVVADDVDLVWEIKPNS